ncbi:MAG TPA: AAA family ATPase [Microlunatus sp.]|nr:AAA family ATPase [Microlunatus sp.]
MSASRPPSDNGSGDNDGADRVAAAWGESPNQLPGVVGRGAELEALAAGLGDARTGRTTAVVLEGEPGVGKTTLLEAAERLGSGFRRLRATGAETESVLAYAGLLQLITPVRDRVAGLPAGQRGALGHALGWDASSEPAERFLVSGALLSLLAAVADEGPVLVLVDDLQWLDRESADAIVFAARRLTDVGICFVIAGRDGSARHSGLGLPVITVTGLTPTDCRRLVGSEVSDTVATKIAGETAGNPLAIIELTRALTAAQRVGAAPLPDTVPVGQRLLRVYADRLAELTDASRRALLLTALHRSGDPSVITTALQRAGDDPAAALDDALDRGLLVHREGAPVLAHPLVRAAVIELTSPADRRAAHRALADASGGEAAQGAVSAAVAWHRAEAATGPDPQVALDLVEVAGWTRDRHGYASASVALERAAVLTDDPARRDDWLARAAADAFVAGDNARSRALATRVLEGAASAGTRGRVLFTLGMIEQYAGSVPLAVELLTSAAELVDAGSRTRALTELALARFRVNDVVGMAACASSIRGSVQAEDPAQLMMADFTCGIAAVVGGDPGRGHTWLTSAIERITRPPLRDDPQCLPFLALAAGFVGDPRPVAHLAAYQLDLARERAALGVLVPALALMAAGRAWLGDHAGAFADAGEAAELGDQLGYAADTAVAVEMLAWQSAARGFHPAAETALDRARALTDRAGTTDFAAHRALTAAFCALSRDDPAEVVAILEARISADGGVGSMGEPLGVAPDLVEAYLQLGRSEDARRLAERFAEVTPAAVAPGVRAVVARCRALTAGDPEEARAGFEEALAAHDQAPEPFEVARTRLLYGARLRRDGHRVQAREQLRAAYDAFAGMDFTVWAQRALGELSATGASPRGRSVQLPEPLTSQETRVALQAARGWSNKQIAAALFLSPKTIEHHLSSVYRKRGFRSRAELAASFRAADDG